LVEAKPEKTVLLKFVSNALKNQHPYYPALNLGDIGISKKVYATEKYPPH
jgi:hypothetical protein